MDAIVLKIVSTGLVCAYMIALIRVGVAHAQVRHDPSLDDASDGASRRSVYFWIAGGPLLLIAIASLAWLLGVPIS